MSFGETLAALCVGPFACLAALSGYILILALSLAPTFIIASIIGITSWIIDLHRSNNLPVPYEVKLPLIYVLVSLACAPGTFLALVISGDIPVLILLLSMASLGINIYAVVLLRDNFHGDATKNKLFLDLMKIQQIRGEGYINVNHARVLLQMLVVLLVIMAATNFCFIVVGVLYKLIHCARKPRQTEASGQGIELQKV
ncbi:hypothetical protein FPQ18DRAFT_394109 [Pyronema domesticum]|uniref:Uncharacterized protein n=1 Tax=Pyronema omphalodes (strain CBS 100304) TaxID=1076935 RepID=U4LKV0_PYROM|nr:hypothetical protein FPQ18DRAFT_394109 [Pyronema domesticum]CCX29990.1 Protein of unknown function [Pyronema omphalodes CBS 100304]